MKTSKIEFLYNSLNFSHIVITPVQSEFTYVIAIDPDTGNPSYYGIPLYDIFPDHYLAIDTLTNKYEYTARYPCEGVIGITNDGKHPTLGLIDQSEVVAWVSNGHLIRKVVSVKYFTFPPTSNKSLFEKFQIEQNHFFCETYDVSRAFPSEELASNPDTEFLWNNSWLKPFDNLGLRNCCISLMQGVAISSQLPGKDYSITYIARRSPLNPGVRYYARGLNELNYPGNEIECQLIIEQGEQFWTNTWRRGSPPIRWETILNSKLASPVHKPLPNFSTGTKEYFKRLKTEYGELPINVVCFLETKPECSEIEVYEAFEKTIKGLNDKNVIFTPYDLNHQLHTIGATETEKNFSKVLSPLVQKYGFTYGTLPNQIKEKQKGYFRFNCADSLDRVNLGTFFYALSVLKKWSKKKTLDQDVIDFLVKAFINSGHIISCLSTNTPAIKTHHFKKYSTLVEEQPNDTAITLQRRYENVQNDPERQKIFEVWTKPLTKMHTFRVDPLHISCLPSEFPVEMFDDKVHLFELNSQTQSEVTLALTGPLKLRQISLKGFTATAFMVMCGLSLSEMQPVGDYTIPTVDSKNWCIFKTKSDWCHFITIRFFSLDETYIGGNIRLNVRLDNEKHNKLDQNFSVDEGSLAAFTDMFDEFLSSPKQFEDVMKLEKSRISLMISEDNRFNLAIKAGINPWICDPVAQIKRKQHTTCAFCGQNMGTHYYEKSDIFPGLFVQYKNKNKFLTACNNCYDIADNIAAITDIYETQHRTIDSPPEARYLTTIPPKLDHRLDLMSTESTALFTENKYSGLLAGKPVTIQAGINEMKIFFMKYSVITHVEIDSSKPVQLLVEGVEMECEDGKSFTFPEPEIVQFLTFKVKADEECQLNKFEVYGKFTEVQQESFKTIEKQVDFPDIQADVEGTWNQDERTHVFEFPEAHKLDGILIDFTKNSSKKLIFVYFNQDKMVGSTVLLLPLAGSGTRLFYPNVENVQFDKIKVYYVDAIKKVEKHFIRFRFQ